MSFVLEVSGLNPEEGSVIKAKVFHDFPFSLSVQACHGSMFKYGTTASTFFIK